MEDTQKAEESRGTRCTQETGGDMGGRRQCKKWSWTHSNITGMCINRHAGLFDVFVWQHIEITSEIQMCSCLLLELDIYY